MDKLPPPELKQVLSRSETLLDSKMYVKAVIHGRWGVGKTTFAADAPNPYWIDFERSSDTLRKMESMAQTKILRPKTVKEVWDVVKVAEHICETLVFDTVTSFQIFYMREYMREEEATSKRNRDKYDVYMGDYKYATAELTDFFLQLQEAPVNVIFCAHSIDIMSKPKDQNDSPQLVSIQPEITPKVWAHLAAFINVVGYLEKVRTITGNVERRLYLNETNVIKAKNRLGIQEDFIKQPTYKGIFT